MPSLMVTSGWQAQSRNWVNAGFGLMCPLGAFLFLLGVEQLGDMQHYYVGLALAFSAGVFLCISLSDLLPEVQFHDHDRFKLSFTLLGGVALAYLIGFLEPPHAHDIPGEHGHSHGEQEHKDSDHPHDHDHDHDH